MPVAAIARITFLCVPSCATTHSAVDIDGSPTHRQDGQCCRGRGRQADVSTQAFSANFDCVCDLPRNLARFCFSGETDHCDLRRGDAHGRHQRASLVESSCGRQQRRPAGVTLRREFGLRRHGENRGRSRRRVASLQSQYEADSGEEPALVPPTCLLPETTHCCCVRWQHQPQHHVEGSVGCNVQN